MDIGQVLHSQTTGAASNTQQQSKSMGKDEFLQLLVAQMKNQDPTNPLKGTEFATQLAQFNSVEQLLNLNSSMSAMVNSQEMMASSLSNVMTASLVGKSVTAVGSHLHLEAGGTSRVHYRLNGSAETVEITIKDVSGNVIRTENLSGVSSGDNVWEWDGKDNGGHTAAEGTYQVEVEAKNGDSIVNSLTLVEGEVESVKYGADFIELIVDGVPVHLGDVEEVRK